MNAATHRGESTVKTEIERLLTIVLFVLSLSTSLAGSQEPDHVNGEWYDWQKTLQPERPWMHDYSQTLVMKIHLCDRDGQGHVKRVYLTFAEALDVIRKLDNITLGIPKIIYLVGWQFNGHDSGYPSWSVVNQALKRPQDRTALDSLKWLMIEARRYHTVVSLHINMLDAYKDSPSWKSYYEKDVIIKDANGEPIQGELMDGMQSYQISYAQEWKMGLAQKRINNLLSMLPELRSAGTIHIDAFHSVQPTRNNLVLANDPSSPFVHFTVEDEMAAQRQIIRFWRMNGVDVTDESAIELLKQDPFIGLTPMAWWFDAEAFRTDDWFHKPTAFIGLPPSLYTGTPMHAEEEIMRDPDHLRGLTRQFCEKVVPWYYANNTAPKEEGLSWPSAGYGPFTPALWRPFTIVACGVSPPAEPVPHNMWELPRSWGDVSTVKLMQITPEGLKQKAVLPVKNHKLELILKPGDVFAIQK
jgi:hypothetical protein